MTSQQCCVDFGGSSVKAGLSCEENPSLVFPSILGTKSKESMTNISVIMDNEVIVNKEGFSSLLSYVSSQTNHPTDWIIPFTCLEIQEKRSFCEVLFEEIGFEKLLVLSASDCALKASHSHSGLIVDMGHSSTRITAYYNGVKVQEGKMKIGGKHVLALFTKQLTEKAHYRKNPLQDQWYEKIIKKSCQVYKSFEEKEEETFPSQTFQLPDGNTVRVDNERFRAPEIFFHPDIEYIESYSQFAYSKRKDWDSQLCLPALMNDIIQRCPPSTQDTIVNNIYLSGGCSMIKGIGERIESELSSLLPCNAPLRIIGVPHRDYNIWKGAVNIAREGSNIPWQSKDQYDEEGVRY